MKGILSKFVILLCVLLTISCDISITTYDFKNFSITFESFNIKKNSTFNEVTDSPESEYFLTDSTKMINITIVQSENYTYDDFSKFESRYHGFCQDMDRSYPSEYFRVAKNKKYSNGEIEINELIYRKESNLYYPIFMKSLINNSGSISVRFISISPVENFNEILIYQNNIIGSVQIRKRKGYAVEH